MRTVCQYIWLPVMLKPGSKRGEVANAWDLFGSSVDLIVWLVSSGGVRPNPLFRFNVQDISLQVIIHVSLYPLIVVCCHSSYYYTIG